MGARGAPDDVVVAALGDGSLGEVAAFVAARQQDPTANVVLVGVEPGPVAEELAGVDRWRERTVVARDAAGGLVGVVVADVAEDMRRVWWVGPWVAAGRADAEGVAAALLDTATAAHGHTWDEEEYAPDARNELVAALALGRGATPGTGSAVLLLDPLVVAELDGPDVRAAVPTDHGAVAALHDRLFPGTHTRGADLLAAEGTHVDVVEGPDGVPVGYVAVEVQPDGSGYVDYLGVAEQARGRGLGRLLVAGALRGLAARGVPFAHLTVRVDNPAARALYASLGFVEERVTVPYRRGFDLG